MKKMKLFRNGEVVGSVFKGRGFIDGQMVHNMDTYEYKAVEADIREVFSRVQQGRELELEGRKMELVRHCGSVSALFKDEIDDFHAAVFCETFFNERTGRYTVIRPVKLFHPPLKINGKDSVTKWVIF